jgi:hypothetical protein
MKMKLVASDPKVKVFSKPFFVNSFSNLTLVAESNRTFAFRSQLAPTSKKDPSP